MTSKGKINFNVKHLKKGDPLPPYNGKLRVYNMRFCPYAQRTILTLNAKNVDYEVVNVDLVSKPEWLPKKSPLGKVPALEVKEDVSIYESLITAEYLDEAYPQRPLLPKDPVKKAFDKILLESILRNLEPLFFKIMKAPESITDEVLAAYHATLSLIEEQVKSRGTFLGGDQPGYVDYMIWPWLERIHFMIGFNETVVIDPKKFPILAKYIENMLKDPAVSQYLIPAPILIEFFKGYRSGNPNYELLNLK